ncbi:BON domain-containing protein [Herbiconiux sp.]|uniref:BON domain-containing protein n=1 Tax=Herbiconiux sp. TaxID=1871186 RepID=UPI0025C33004|nr:BON domain-containing protein [Herbiconiux sp.]
MTYVQGKVPTDTAIQQMVEDELASIPGLWSTQIGVSVGGRVVTLSGDVSTLEQLSAATAAALGVTGVQAVASDLQIRALHHTPTDTVLAEAIVQRLAWNASVPDGAISVVVHEGNVILTGEVHWDFQRRVAESSIRRMRGVRWIDNRITLTPREPSRRIREHIRTALSRSALTHGCPIDVAVADGAVTLAGFVPSNQAKRHAEHIAWNEPHVVAVVNELEIGHRAHEAP